VHCTRKENVTFEDAVTCVDFEVLTDLLLALFSTEDVCEMLL
jgi:hypothetical protein